jgi:secretion/DNA translocation related CpaE-like protein
MKTSFDAVSRRLASPLPVASSASGSTRPLPPAAKPLLVSADPQLLDEVRRLAAIAGIEVTVVPDLIAAVSAWSTAPCVIVGADAVTATVTVPRRSDVVIVTGGDAAIEVWRSAVLIGAVDVLESQRDSDVLLSLLADAAEGTHRGAVVGFVGGRGGVGTSSLSVATALAAVRAGLRTVLVDLDPSGGGLDLMLRGEDADGIRWNDLAPIEGRLPADALVRALPLVHGLNILSCARHGDVLSADQVHAVLQAAERAFDLVVLDLPRAFDDAALVAARTARMIAVLVAADVRGCAAAQAIVERHLASSTEVVTVARSGPGRTLPCDEVADAVGAPLLAELRDDPRAPIAYERGEPPSSRSRGPWAPVTHAVLAQLGLAEDRRAA